MCERIPAFDSWGNYVGYFTEASGCGDASAVATVILIIPLVAVFHIVNVFRIGRRLIENGQRAKAILWFTPWPGAPILYGLGALLVGGMEPIGSSLLGGVITSMYCLIMLAMGPGYIVQLVLCFKYAALDF